jgi:hypothetical protein
MVGGDPAAIGMEEQIRDTAGHHEPDVAVDVIAGKCAAAGGRERVIDDGRGSEHGWPAGCLKPPAEIDILAVHEQSFIEDVTVALEQVIERRASVEGGATAGGEDRCFVIVLAVVIEPDTTVERHSADRPAVAGRVEPLPV